MTQDETTEPDEPLGRREANKRATRAALQTAADRLFAERGYAATTVRDIADAAGVTQRTFFRYFQGKEDLILDDALSWLPQLADLIRHRPASEGPLVAIRQALIQATGRMTSEGRPTPIWIFTDGPPAERIRPRGYGILLGRIESTVADALVDRVAAPVSERDRYRCSVLARCAVAVVRSALIRDWELRSAEVPDAPRTPELIDQAFADLAEALDNQTITKSTRRPRKA